MTDDPNVEQVYRFLFQTASLLVIASDTSGERDISSVAINQVSEEKLEEEKTVERRLGCGLIRLNIVIPQ